MIKKILLLGMLAVVLTFGMMFVSCDDGGGGGGGGGDPDTWSNVTSLTQLNGTWKGSFSESDSQGGMTQNATYEMTMTINATNANSGTMSGSMKATITYSGLDADTYAAMKQSMQGTTGVTFNDSARTISMTYTEAMPSQQMTMEDMEGVQINQNGTKVKTPANTAAPVEMIFTKVS